MRLINYFCLLENQRELKISLKGDTNMSHEINILHNKFRMQSPLQEIHEVRFVNLSEKNIPHEVRLLLELGERFGLPLIEKDKENN